MRSSYLFTGQRPRRMSVSAGGEHTLYRKNGNIFSAGACGLGWCRLHPLSSALFQFRSVPLEEKCRLFHASYYHNLAVGAQSGRLYSWGCGTFTDDGSNDGVIPALGCDGPRASDRGEMPKPVDGPLGEANYYSNQKEEKEHENQIIQVTGGAYHSAVLTRAGTVFTFGAGQLGQLGRALQATDASGLPVDPTPSPAKVPAHDKVTRIGAGFYNTFAQCQSGSLYCTGENQNQQCGVGPKNLQTLTKIEGIEHSDRVEGGYCHTLVRTLKGTVLSLGCGDDGQRGDGRLVDDDDDEDVERDVITSVALPDGVKAMSVAAGANHSVILGDNGVAYAFGANDVGQCGVPSDHNQNDDIDDDDDDQEGGPVLAPKPVGLPKDAGSVTQISAGYAHTVLTTETGKLFVFGQNDNGQLGLGSNTNNPEAQTLPKEVIVNNSTTP